MDDYGSMEAKIGVYSKYPWETVTSIAYPRYTWGPDLKYKSVPYLIESLSRVVCGNGNYLLAFIPDVNGKIPAAEQKIAVEMGAWVHKSADAIFDTHAGPYYPNKWGGSTSRGSKVYLYIMSEAPEKFSLPPLGARIISTEMITDGVIKVIQTKKGFDHVFTGFKKGFSWSVHYRT